MNAIHEFVPDISWSNGSGNTLGTITVTNMARLQSLITAAGYDPSECTVVLVRKMPSSGANKNRILDKAGIIDGRHQGSHKTYKWHRLLGNASQTSFTINKSDLRENSANNTRGGNIDHEYVFFGIFVTCLINEKNETIEMKVADTATYNMTCPNPLKLINKTLSCKPVPRIPDATKLSIKCIKASMYNETGVLSNTYVCKD